MGIMLGDNMTLCLSVVLSGDDDSISMSREFSGESKKAKLRVTFLKKPLTSFVLLPYKHRLPAASGSGTTFGFIRKHCIILRVKKLAKFFINGCVVLHWTKSKGGEELVS